MLDTITAATSFPKARAATPKAPTYQYSYSPPSPPALYHSLLTTHSSPLADLCTPSSSTIRGRAAVSEMEFIRSAITHRKDSYASQNANPRWDRRSHTAGPGGRQSARCKRIKTQNRSAPEPINEPVSDSKSTSGINDGGEFISAVVSSDELLSNNGSTSTIDNSGEFTSATVVSVKFISNSGSTLNIDNGGEFSHQPEPGHKQNIINRKFASHEHWPQSAKRSDHRQQMHTSDGGIFASANSTSDKFTS
ncbi:hypothetical protein MMC30_006543 [Trapelia coarctata]|nr:hypothetical protein [Trapelia coarctata]